MANFPPQFLDELRARVSLEDVVGRRVKLIRRGREYVGLSPFQNEKTPSFTVVPEKGFYHDFSSGEHGDVIDFVMKTESLSFPEAVERLAAEAGMDVPVDSPEEREREKARQTLFDALEAACAWFERTLRMPEGKAGLDYLRRRGLDDDTIATFRLGFAPERGGLKAALARTGVPEDLMRAGGLVRRPDDGRPDYDYFRGRVIFPITDRRGRILAFGGRILGDGQPKYLNSPESAVFRKGHVLYGLGQAIKPAREAGTVVIAEGYMDVIALHRAGFKNAVAPLGTALTEEQLQGLWRIVREPVLCFDGDAAGQKAAVRGALRALPLLKPGYGVRFALLPAGEDPDSLIAARGPEAFREVLAATQPLSEILWRLETRGRPPASPEERAALEERLRRHALTVADPSVRNHFLRAFKDRLWQETRATGRRGDSPRPPIRVDARPGRAVDPRHRTQQVMLAAVINHPDLFDAVGEQLGRMAFSDPGLDALRHETVNALASGQDLDRDGLLGCLESAGQGDEVAALFGDPLVRAIRGIRPAAEASKALETWEDCAAELHREEIQADRQKATEALADDMSAEGWKRARSILAGESD